MIKPKIGDIIKHRRFMDIAVWVQKPVIMTDSGKMFIRGMWINQAFVSTFPLGIKMKYRIPPDKIHEWMICDNPHAKCVRYEKWTPLKKEKAS